MKEAVKGIGSEDITDIPDILPDATFVLLRPQYMKFFDNNVNLLKQWGISAFNFKFIMIMVHALILWVILKRVLCRFEWNSCVINTVFLL